MNIIGQIDPSAFATCPRMHHRLDESTPEFPSSAGSRVRNLLALKACNWRAIGGGEMKIIKVEQDINTIGEMTQFIGANVTLPMIMVLKDDTLTGQFQCFGAVGTSINNGGMFRRQNNSYSILSYDATATSKLVAKAGTEYIVYEYSFGQT